ncbi:MAG TPA: DUF349 domain-containing protein [Microbacteriaceae bacterium]|nr:DUF349 domain-containing protein [Microbacteriaceae bacterium]
MATSDQHPWGRVDETGTVFVRTADGERAVGQFPDGSADEALAYFERKFADLEGQVRLLEQRARLGSAANAVAKAAATLRANLDDAAAVGDLAALVARVDALVPMIQNLGERQDAEAKEALRAAIDERTLVVEEMERLAAQDPATIRWKDASARMDELFAQWRAQQAATRLPKATAEGLWKRFRQARSGLERGRRAFFAQLDETHRAAKRRKEELVGEAEALIAAGSSGTRTYQGLLTAWKAAGRAGKKTDDALWARFKAAGDAIYAAKGAEDAEAHQEQEENLAAKRALLDEAEPALKGADRAEARQRLRSLQEHWDEIGPVPRESLRAVEGRLRKMEQAVRKMDDDAWREHDPEKKARSDGMVAQLTDSIAQLERDLAAASAAGDARRSADIAEALETRRHWLDALR